MLQTGSLQKLSQNISQLTVREGKSTISVYSGKLTTECIIKQVKKLKAAFPGLPVGFYDVLSERVKGLGFCDQRLIDAVNNCIDTCAYPAPAIANIISWDKRIELHTYHEILELVGKYGVSVWDDYKALKTDGVKKRVFASVVDIERYNLEIL